MTPVIQMAHQSTPARDVIVLIDWENLKRSLDNTYGVLPDAKRLMGALDAHGRIVMARAYADWFYGPLRGDVAQLYQAAIEPVYVPGGVKNNADIRLAVDAVDLGSRLSNAQVFCLVTGDHGLIHPLRFLQQHGRHVIVVGVNGCKSNALSKAADLALVYEQDIDPSISAAGIASAPDDAPAGMEPVTLESLGETERRSLLEQLRALETPARSLSFRRVATELSDGWRSDLGEKGIYSLLNHLADRGILDRVPATSISANGEVYSYTRLILNEEHAAADEEVERHPQAA